MVCCETFLLVHNRIFYARITFIYYQKKKMTTYSSNSMSSIPDLISSSVSLDLGKVVKIDKFVVDGTHYIVKY